MPDPVSVLADGNLKVVWVPVIANIFAPTVLELNAASGVDLSCYLTPDGYTPGGDMASVTDDRLCSLATYEKAGRETNSLSLKYIYQPQLPAATDNKAYSTLVSLTTGFIVERWGKIHSSAFVAADRVDIKTAQCGQQMKLPPEANSTLKVEQGLFISAVARNVAVVA